MSITFPRSDILDGLKFAPGSGPFRPLWRVETSRSPSRTITKELGPPLWQGAWQTVPMPNFDAQAVMADLHSLAGGVELFEAWDPYRPLPAADGVTEHPGAVVAGFGSASLLISSMPPGFVITKGDYVSVDDGTNLHLMQFLEGGTVAGGGSSGVLRITPATHPAIGLGDPVTLRYPKARFVIDPASITFTPSGPLHASVSWSGTQVIL